MSEIMYMYLVDLRCDNLFMHTLSYAPYFHVPTTTNWIGISNTLGRIAGSHIHVCD